jgi:MFS family permease
MEEKKSPLLTPTFIAAYASFLMIATGNSLFVLYPLYLKGLGKDDAQIGVLMGLMAFAALMSRPFLGSAIDRSGRRIFILLGSLLNGLIIFAYALPFHGVIALALLRIIHGFAYAAYFMAIWTWIADYAPEGRLAESLGVFGTAGLSSMAMGAFLGERILSLFNGSFFYFFALASALVLLGSMISLLLPELRSHAMMPRHGFLGLVRRCELFTVAFACVVFGLAMGAVQTFAAPYLKEQHQLSVSSFFIIYSCAAVGVRFLAGRLADRLGKVTLIIPGLLILGAGQALFGEFPATWCAILMSALLGGGHGLIYPALYALMLERAGSMDRGSAGALLNASGDIGTFGGASIFGVVARDFGYMIMYIDAGLSTAGGLLIFLLLEKMLCRCRGSSGERQCESRPQ